MQREYDLVLWGATGFTGRLAVDYIERTYRNSNLKWAIAGRSASKLDSIDGARGLSILQADASDRASMEALVRQTRLVLTTVGPYARYGSELVKACAENGTHYCDLTGEVQWMRKMMHAHQSAAEQSGAKILFTCGFDSLPSDLGTYALQQESLKKYGVPASEVKYRTRDMKGGFSGGSMDSMMAMLEQTEQDPSIPKLLADPYSLNEQWRGQDGLDRLHHFYDEDFASWIGPFVMAPINTRIVRRSNELLNFAYGYDFRYEEGMATGTGPKGLMGALALAAGLRSMMTLPRFKPVRRGMQKIMPKPGEGPSEADIKNGYFEVELLAIHTADRTRDLRLTVKGKEDPGYGATARMIGECAVCLAQDELSVGGGFWTPASAMGDELLQRLPENAGITFELHV